MIKEPIRCEDAGFFGPDSISWRISGPTIVPGVVVTGAYFFLNPWLASIGISNSTGASDPWKRIVLTTEYMFAIYFGDRATATHAADVVNSMHDHVIGTWGPTGERQHCASEPRNLMWLLIPYGQGALDAYDAYGPRPLTLEERDRYWREESTIVGDLNRIPRDMMPQSQAEVDDYLEAERANLALTESGRFAFDAFNPRPRQGLKQALTALPMRAALASGIALTPDYLMRLYGAEPYPALVKEAVRIAHRPMFAALSSTPVVRDTIPLAVSAPVRTLIRRARACARTGIYDPPLADTSDIVQQVSATS
ncbi:oxygenase MpaB family protein [Mycobacteroides chelonae]|nr:oxygenase MpaB family protein [Mycobacteroides chelonae]